MVFLVVLSAVAQCSITILLNRTFYYCHLANLNIGIAQSVQSSTSFFAAIVDYIIFNMSLKPSQFLGMIIILGCVLCISLSSLGKATFSEVEASMPVYIPILMSLTVPVVMSLNLMIAKTATTVFKVSARDFTLAFFLLMSIVTFAMAIFYFYINLGSFNMRFFFIGIGGSTAQIIAILCIN